MTPKMQALAKAAFQQGLDDESVKRYNSARLRIDHRVRHFYDAGREKRAEELRPEREAKAAAYAAREAKIAAETRARLAAAMPAIKAKLSQGDGLGAARLVLNAHIGI